MLSELFKQNMLQTTKELWGTIKWSHRTLRGVKFCFGSLHNACESTNYNIHWHCKFHHYVEDLQSTINSVECWWVVSIIWCWIDRTIRTFLRWNTCGIIITKISSSNLGMILNNISFYTLGKQNFTQKCFVISNTRTFEIASLVFLDCKDHEGPYKGHLVGGMFWANLREHAFPSAPISSSQRSLTARSN